MKRYRITEKGYIAEEISMSVSPDMVSSADFKLDKSGNATLIRWSRTSEYAHVPEKVDGHRVTGIAPLAFASIHLPEDVWDGFSSAASLSFSIFCMRNANLMSRDGKDAGGPYSIILPDSVEEVGRYAFWRCDRLQGIRLPSAITQLREGVFGECSRLKSVLLPSGLEQIGGFYPDTVQVMPDIGTFAGCRSLTELVLPATLTAIGAEAFNSSGLEQVIVEDKGTIWSRTFRIHPSAFNHTAALQWLSRKTEGRITWQIGLPAARDKILTCDKKYQEISKLPVHFFEKTPDEIDLLTMACFRLDFAGRMAIARLTYPESLDRKMYQWYQGIIVDYFDRLGQFWPGAGDKEAEAIDLLCRSEYFTAESLGRLMYIAGKAQVRTELMFKMQKIRNTKFSAITGLEDLEL